MKRFGAFVSAILMATLAMAMGCSSDEDDDDNDSTRAQGGQQATGGTGAVLPTGGTGALTPTGGTGNVGATSSTGGSTVAQCADIEGLDDACHWTTNEAQVVEVDVLLVLDKSGSMDDVPSDYSTNKWNAISNALNTALNSVRERLWLGLLVFPYTATEGVPIPANCREPTDRCCEMPPIPGFVNVPVGPGRQTFNDMMGVINTSQPAGGTPTALALQRALEYFTGGAGAALGGEKIVLLATDGGPNCNPNLTCTVDTCTLNIDQVPGCPSADVDPNALTCCGANPTGCLDDANTVAQVQALAAAGIKTIVVGIPGAEPYQETLLSSANAGSFLTPEGEPGYYEVPVEGGVQALTDTFQEITTQLVKECEVDVTGMVDNPNDVNVAVDCVLIPMGQAGGEGSRWYYDNPENPTKIIIDGDICTTIQTTGVQRIDVVLGCPVVIGV
jgi:hypothetical protein